jgi:hypothetical protein
VRGAFGGERMRGLAQVLRGGGNRVLLWVETPIARDVGPDDPPQVCAPSHHARDEEPQLNAMGTVRRR